MVGYCPSQQSHHSQGSSSPTSLHHNGGGGGLQDPVAAGMRLSDPGMRGHPTYSINGILGIHHQADANDNLLKRKRDEEG